MRPCGKRGSDTERMLNPLEIRGQRQLRRRWRKRGRRQEDRGADRAIAVIVGNWRRHFRWGVRERHLSGYGDMRTAAEAVQMHVTKREHYLQRQRDQRQHRTVLSMVLNPAHPQNLPLTTMLAFQ
jgi:hypothetical protein